MHVLVVEMITQPDGKSEVLRHLRDDVTAWAKSQPGFVSGQWLLDQQANGGLGVVTFDSAESAMEAAKGPREVGQADGQAWSIDKVAVYEQVSTA
jgi:hypothetical protein